MPEVRSAESGRLTRREAEMGQDVAVLRTKQEEIVRDLSRVEKQVTDGVNRLVVIGERVTAALEKMVAVQLKPSGPNALLVHDTAPHTVVNGGKKQAYVLAGSGAVGGATILALAKMIIDAVGGG